MLLWKIVYYGYTHFLPVRGREELNGAAVIGWAELFLWIKPEAFLLLFLHPLHLLTA